jgi:hypothetical protein
MNRIVLACSVAAGVSLYFVYALATILFVRHLDVSTITLVESVVIISQMARLAGVVAYYGAKPARVEVLLVLFSFETFVVMALILRYLAAPAPIFSSLADTIFSTWIAALFVVLPSYLAFVVVSQMAHYRSLTAVLLSVALEFGFLTFAATTMLAFSGTITFAGFFDFLIGAARADVTAGSVPALTTLYILVPSVAVFCSLLVYTTIPTATSLVPAKVTFVLPLLGAAIALAWVFAAVLFIPNTLLSFTVPGIVIAALLWAYMRR